MLRTTFAAALAAGALMLATAAVGAEGSSKGGAENNGTVIYLQGPAAARSAASLALLKKAADKKQVRVIVGMTDTFKDGLKEEDEHAEVARLRASQNALARRAGVPADNVVTFEYIPFVSMWVNAAQLRRLLDDRSVVSIQEDLPGDLGLKQSVPKIFANAIWNAGFDGNPFAVAVLDTGVDRAHPMFAGKVVSEACYSTKNAAQGLQSVCPGAVTASTAVNSGVDCKPRGFAGCDHGTHVAGIAAGNGPTLDGVARGSKIIAIQVFTKQGQNVVTFDGDWIKGLNRVYALRSQFKIASINMSLGRGRFTGPCDADSPAALAIIKKLRDAKIATLVASMNDSWNGDMRLPACISTAIAVGSTTKTDGISSFSNHALQVRHMAPGSDILSAKPGNGYQQLSGTSMATPHVAGAYALMRDIRPNATIDDISAALECTGVNVTRAGTTEKRIQLVQARNYLLNPPKAVKNFPFNSLAANDGGAWGVHMGSWGLGGGLLQITDGLSVGGWKVATTANCNESLNISARMEKGAGASGVNGILFKAQFSGPFVGGYLAGYNPPNRIVFLRLDGYSLQADSGKFKQFPCTNRALVAGFNTVAVQSRGGVHKLFINGAVACTAVDFTYGTGRVGVATFHTQQTTFKVDSVKIAPAEVLRDSDGKPDTDEPEGEDLVADAASLTQSLVRVSGEGMTPLAKYLEGAE